MVSWKSPDEAPEKQEVPPSSFYANTNTNANTDTSNGNNAASAALRASSTADNICAALAAFNADPDKPATGDKAADEQGNRPFGIPAKAPIGKWCFVSAR